MQLNKDETKATAKCYVNFNSMLRETQLCTALRQPDRQAGSPRMIKYELKYTSTCLQTCCTSVVFTH